MKLTRALVAGFVEKQHSWVGIASSTFDGAVTALIDNAVEFSLQVGNIIQSLVFLAVAVSIVEADEPPRAVAVEFTMMRRLIFRFNCWACF